MEVPQPYAYSALEQESSIRLVVLQPALFAEAISLDIEVHDLSQYPEYEALSYEWGSASNRKAISAGGTRLHVQENLYWALQHLRLVQKPRRLWIDALCINQDDTKERNHQVALMATIYKAASTVLVWLGREAEDDVKAFECIEDIVLRSSRMDLSDDVQVRRYIQKWSSMLQIWGRSYWRRLWIIQEIIHASRIVLHCGEEVLDWSFIEILCKQSIILAAPLWTGYKEVLLEQLEKTNLYRFVKQRAHSSPREGTLLELVLLYKDATCMDVRDKVFGLHSLAQDCCRVAVPVDYSAGASSIVEKVVQHHFPMHGMLNGEPQNEQRQVIAKCQMVFAVLSQNVATLGLRTTIEPSIADTGSSDILFPVIGILTGRVAFTSLFSNTLPIRDDYMFTQPRAKHVPTTEDNWLEGRIPTAQFSSDIPPREAPCRLGHVKTIENSRVSAEPKDFRTRQRPERIRGQDIDYESFSKARQYALDYFTRNHKGVSLQFFMEESDGDTRFGFAPADTKQGDLLCQFESSDIIVILRKVEGDDQRYNITGTATPISGEVDDMPFFGSYLWGEDEVPGHLITLWLDSATLLLLARP